MNLDELAQKYGGSPVQSGSSKFDDLAQKYGGVAVEAAPAPARKSTIGSEIVRGGKQLASSVQTGAESLFGSPEEAARAGIARSEKIGEAAGEGVSFDAVKKAYENKGLLSAAGEAISQVPRALAGQVPQLAAMAGGAKLGAMAGAPLGPAGVIGGGIVGAGATLLPQFFGSNVERQAAEQIAKGENVSIDRGRAGAAAAGQAALEGAGTAFTLGKGIVKGVLGISDDAALMTAKAQQSMKAAAERSLLQAAGRGAVKGAAVEMPVEVAQSVIERAQAGLDVTSPEAIKEYGEAAYQAGLVGGPLGAVGGATNTVMARQGVEAKAAFDEAEKKRVAEEAAAKQEPAPPSPTKAIEDQAAEIERQQQRQNAAMERARAGGIGGGSEVNQALLDQARIRKEQQERAAAAQEKAAEAERQKGLRAERARITNTQYSGDPMMNEVLRSRAIAEFDSANAPKVEAPKIPEYQPTKTLEQMAPITQPEGFNVLRGVDARNTDLMSAVAERRAAQEAAAAAKAKETEVQKKQEAVKADTSRADVDRRVAQVENFLMSPVKKTQQETADYMAGVVPEMQKDFLALLDEDMSQPLTPEQTESLKTQIRQRLQPDFVPDEKVQRTPFKTFLATKGMNTKDVQDIFGENAYRANQQLPGAIKATGPRLDMLAEAAVESGFLQEEDTEALVQMIKDEFGGNQQVAVDMADDRAAAEYEAQRENELLSRAGAIGLPTKGMKPDQIAARLDRIERKREEKRKQYNRSVDGFADLPTAEQDRIIDMMIDQFGEPQVFDVERAEIEGRVREEEELLQTQTEKQLRDKQAEIDRLAKENERLSKEAERKAKADEEAGDFVLTGSGRDADKAAARGQMDLTEGKEPTREEILSGVKALAEKLLSKGTVKYEDTELGGNVYQVITRTFEGKLFGSELRTVREALGNATEVTLVNEEDQVMTLSLPGRNVGEGAKVRVMDSKYVPEDQMEDQTEDLRTSEEIKDAIIALNKRMSSTLTSKGNAPARGSKGDETYQALKKERDLLVKKFDKAEARERGESQKPMRSSEGSRGYDISAEDQRIEKELTGKSMIQVADWTVANAPNAFAKVIAEKVRSRLREFERKGMTLDFSISGGATRPRMLSGARGVTQFEWGKDDKGSKITVTLNGAAVMDNQGGYPPGVQYNTVLHELLHVATRSQFVFMPNTDPLKKQMTELFNTVVDRFNADAKAGNLPPVMEKYYKRMNNVLEDPDELLTWGLTDKDVQTYLDDIKVGEKSIFTQLVELIRKALGLGKPYESALERLVRTSESMLDIDVDTIDSMLGAKDKQIGVKKKPSGPMVQESLFQKERAPEDADIRYQRDSITGKPILAQWGTPTDTKLAGDIGKDDLIYALQNKMIDTKRVVDAISATAGKIMAKWNPYLQEELYHGRTAKQTKDFLTEELRPLMQAMEKAGVNIEDMETYLKNRHAIAYNAQVAKVNPKMPDGGSGIKTAAAEKYLSGLSKDDKAKYEALAKRVDAITKGTRNLLVEGGLETQKVINNWEKTFPFYVPLRRDDIDYAYTSGGMGTGQGFDVRGSFSKRAMGSEREATDVLANIAMMRERAIVKAQKNRVAQALFGLAAQNPNPDFWLPVDPLAEVDPANMQELINFGLSQEDLDFIAKEPRQKAIDKKKNEVVERINATLRNNENVLSMRFNGENRYVFFNPNDPRAERMVKSLKNLDADQLGHVLGPISKVTRWMAAVNTQYNPIFGAYNFLRDVQGASLQLSDTPLAKERKAVVGGTLPALKGIYSALRAERDGVKATGPWADLWTEFQEQGGQTGFRDQFSRSQERAEALQAELNRIKEGKLKAAGRATFDWLSDYNDSMENAVRLSAYKAALDKGIGKEEAASIAKNLTVNFNRKGQIAVQAGALYAFFNAAMQGTTRLVQTLSGPAGKKIMAGGFMLGTMQAVLLASAGFDEEEPPEFVRERNLILPIGDDKYIAFPMPLGYHVIPSTSRILTEWALSGFKDTPDRIASLTGMFLEAFNPIGNAGWSAQTLAPTFADPIVALTENRDWTGKPIARKDFSNLDPTPGYTRAKDTASEFSTQIAKFLNYASGGTEFKPGVLSPTPDQIDYLIGQGTGGLGREALKLEQTITKTATGEELPPYKIPLVGRFYGETKSSAAESNRFYKNLTKLNEHENEIKGRRAKGEPISEYMAENPEARLAALGRKTYADIQKLRKRKEQLVERDAPRESVQAVEKMITQRMQILNNRVKALEEN